MKKKNGKPELKSPGTLLAEKTRAKANKLSDEQREELLQRGLQMIYGTRS